ncbi:hypothetical protein B0H16DRAFT_1464274 [Mycena metata]|uniref:Uncharacterized protein n=1 Tax=Mycena metata TaxID=1033252 RepID=A0AAD7IFD9_9AGAR|nr:hypothetical protein B0H16DRAFT_1464274 [Mycena metata]
MEYLPPAQTTKTAIDDTKIQLYCTPWSSGRHMRSKYSSALQSGFGASAHEDSAVPSTRAHVPADMRTRIKKKSENQGESSGMRVREGKAREKTRRKGNKCAASTHTLKPSRHREEATQPSTSREAAGARGGLWWAAGRFKHMSFSGAAVKLRRRQFGRQEWLRPDGAVKDAAKDVVWGEARPRDGTADGEKYWVDGMAKQRRRRLVFWRGGGGRHQKKRSRTHNHINAACQDHLAPSPKARNIHLASEAQELAGMGGPGKPPQVLLRVMLVSNGAPINDRIDRDWKPKNHQGWKYSPDCTRSPQKIVHSLSGWKSVSNTVIARNTAFKTSIRKTRK